MEWAEKQFVNTVKVTFRLQTEKLYLPSYVRPLKRIEFSRELELDGTSAKIISSMDSPSGSTSSLAFAWLDGDITTSEQFCNTNKIYRNSFLRIRIHLLLIQVCFSSDVEDLNPEQQVASISHLHLPLIHVCFSSDAEDLNPEQQVAVISHLQTYN